LDFSPKAKADSATNKQRLNKDIIHEDIENHFISSPTLMQHLCLSLNPLGGFGQGREESLIDSFVITCPIFYNIIQAQNNPGTNHLYGMTEKK
jgi:hypothetical protein